MITFTDRLYFLREIISPWKISQVIAHKELGVTNTEEKSVIKVSEGHMN